MNEKSYENGRKGTEAAKIIEGIKAAGKRNNGGKRETTAGRRNKSGGKEKQCRRERETMPERKMRNRDGGERED